MSTISTSIKLKQAYWSKVQFKSYFSPNRLSPLPSYLHSHASFLLSSFDNDNEVRFYHTRNINTVITHQYDVTQELT